MESMASLDPHHAFEPTLTNIALEADPLAVWDLIRVTCHDTVGAVDSEIYIYEPFKRRLLPLQRASERRSYRTGDYRLGNEIAISPDRLIARAVLEPLVVHQSQRESESIEQSAPVTFAVSLTNPVSVRSEPAPLAVVALHVPASEAKTAARRVDELIASSAFWQLRLLGLQAVLRRRMNFTSDLPDLNQALDTILDAVCGLLGFCFATISLVDEYRRKSPDGNLLPRQIRTVRGRHIPEGWVNEAHHSVKSDDIQAHVWRTGKSEVIEGWDARLDRTIFEKYEHAGLVRVFVPFGSIGTIEAGFNADEARKIDPVLVKVLERWAQEASVAVQKTRLYERVKRRSAAIAQLREFNREMDELPPTADRHTVLEKIAQAAQEVLHADLVLFYWAERRGDSEESPIDFFGPVVSGKLRGSARLHSPTDRTNIVQHIASTREVYLQPDAQEDPLLNRDLDAEHRRSRQQLPIRTFTERQGIRAFAGAPLLHAGQVLGVICLNFRHHRSLGDYERELIELFAEEAVEAIARNETSVELALARERRRIARDMHDGVKTNLRTILLNARRVLRNLKGQNLDLETELKDIVLIGWSTMAQIDLILDNLSSSGPDGRPLDEVIEHELSVSLGNERSRIETSLQRNLPTLPMRISQAIRLVLREALANALTHSHGAKIQLTTSMVDGKFVLEVRDDGQGFDFHAGLFGAHRGLSIMQERIEEIAGGRLAIESAIGSGTTVRVEIPCRLIGEGAVA